MTEVPEHFFRQSAVLPYRWSDDQLEILLITSRKKKRWVIPKGVRELELSAAESAAREAWEEAGIEGELWPEPLGTYRYEKWGGTCTVEVFAMSVHSCHDDWPERHRDRRWLNPESAASCVDEIALKRLIRDFSDRMSSDRPSRDP